MPARADLRLRTSCAAASTSAWSRSSAFSRQLSPRSLVNSPLAQRLRACRRRACCWSTWPSSRRSSRSRCAPTASGRCGSPAFSSPPASAHFLKAIDADLMPQAYARGGALLELSDPVILVVGAWRSHRRIAVAARASADAPERVARGAPARMGARMSRARRSHHQHGTPSRPRFWGKHAVAAALDNPRAQGPARLGDARRGGRACNFPRTSR